MNIYDLISRAQQLREETKLDSVSPDRVGTLCEDTLKYINEFQLLASAPSLHKIYASVSAMQLDGAPQSDLTGKALKPGQLVVIVPESQTDATAGDVYRYDGPSGNTSAWTFVAKIGGVPADAELNASSTNPVQNKAVTEKLTELSEEKEDKTNKVTSLSDESTDNQYPSAKCVHDSLSSLAEEMASNGQLIEDLQNMKIDRENDDYYPKMAVGLADNLAGVDVVDSEINFRRSGGGAISDGVARIESIKGNSVVWNQLMPSNKIVVPIGTYSWNAWASGLSFIKGHKYILIVDNAELQARMRLLDTSYVSPTTGVITYNEESTINDGNSQVQLSGTSTKDSQIGWHDLTQMFGAGNEPTTIEEFYQRIPMGVDLNAYNEGEVIHMDVQSIESVGVNQWDEEWELGSISAVTGENINSATQIRSKNFNEIIGGTKYALYCSSVTNSMSRIILYDKDYKLVDYRGFTPNIARIIDVPGNVRFFKVSMDATYGAKYKGDICINVSDTAVNGKYYPHIKRVEDLAVIRKYFPQGMKSAGTAHDEIRYNKESGKWEKVQRIGEVDMGSLPWARNANGSLMLMNATIADIAPALSTATYTNNILQIRYPFDTSGGTTLMNDKTIRRYSRSIYVRDDAYTDAASFKAAMAGVMLYYELAEPIVTELDEADQFKDLDYAVWNAGTEKAIAEGKSAPLAADITYGFNAIGKIKELESLVAALRAKVGI